MQTNFAQVSHKKHNGVITALFGNTRAFGNGAAYLRFSDKDGVRTTVSIQSHQSAAQCSDVSGVKFLLPEATEETYAAWEKEALHSMSEWFADHLGGNVGLGRIIAPATRLRPKQG